MRRLAYLHGKDRKVNDAKGKPFMLEYVNIDNVLMVRDRVRVYDKEQT